jgi:hypothetical protein
MNRKFQRNQGKLLKFILNFAIMDSPNPFWEVTNETTIIHFACRYDDDTAGGGGIRIRRNVCL